MNNNISIIVCTYNRAKLLARLLQSFCEQTIPLQSHEIIVIDNNSNDHTQSTVAQFNQRLPNLCYFFEAKQGLSHARNRGLYESKGNYVGYIDDDAIAPQDWVEVAQDLILTIEPDVFGGPYYPFYDSSKPLWWKDQYRSIEHAEKARFLTDQFEYLSGNNIFFRREILKQLGGFNPQYGMSGDKVATCEEADILLRIREAMPQALIYYDPRLYIRHLVMKDKMSLGWLVRHRFGSGRSHGHMYAVHALSSKRHLFSQTLIIPALLLKYVLLTLWFRDRSRYPYLQNYFFEQILPLIRKSGFLYEQWGLLFRGLNERNYWPAKEKRPLGSSREQ